MLLPHLIVKSWFSSLEGNDVVEKLCPKCDTSQDNTSTDKSPRALQSNSDMDFLPINSMSSKSMTHKQNIIYSPSPSNLELKQSQPLVQWVPSIHEQKCEESVPWRCKGFAPVNHEAKPAEPLNLCKWPASQRLEWCHESLARLAHLGVQSPKNAFPVCRRRPVIQRPLVGHKGTQVVNRHVKKHFCWTSSSSKSLLSEDGPKPATQVDPYNKAVYSSLWSAVQAEAEGCGKKTMQQDGDHTFHRNNVSWLSVSSIFLTLSCFFTPKNGTAPYNRATVLVRGFTFGFWDCRKGWQYGSIHYKNMSFTVGSQLNIK